MADVHDNGAAHFAHAAFGFDGPAEYTATLVPYVGEGLALGEFVAVAGPRDRLLGLRDDLGADARRVRFLPAERWYVRPVRTIGGWVQMLRAAAASGRPTARLVNEVDFREQHPSWVRYESALNAALAGFDVRMLCPYDRARLPAGVLDAAGATHRDLLDGDGCRPSGRYVEPERLLAEVHEPPFPAEGEPIVTVPVVDTVADLRAHLRNRATDEAWLPPARVEVLVLALSEVATNGIRHGGSHRELRVWLNREAVVCEITDDGSRPPGPLAGYLPPTPGRVGGMGLWLVGQICDALSVRTAGGITHARFAVRRT